MRGPVVDEWWEKSRRRAALASACAEISLWLKDEIHKGMCRAPGMLRQARSCRESIERRRNIGKKTLGVDEVVERSRKDPTLALPSQVVGKTRGKASLHLSSSDEGCPRAAGRAGGGERDEKLTSASLSSLLLLPSCCSRSTKLLKRHLQRTTRPQTTSSSSFSLPTFSTFPSRPRPQPRRQCTPVTAIRPLDPSNAVYRL